MLIFDIFDDGIPANAVSTNLLYPFLIANAYHRSLLTWSPYPGVSTMLSLKRTPFSSMTIMTASSVYYSFPYTSIYQGRRTMRDGLNFSRGANGLIGGQTALGVDQM